MKQHAVLINRAKWFSIYPILFNVIRIGIAIGLYYYLSVNDLFPLYIKPIYYIIKTYIALEIIIGSGRTIMMPLLTFSAGMLCLLLAQTYSIHLVNANHAWQLMTIAGIGFLINLLI